MVSERFKNEYLRVARLADPELVDAMEWEKTEGAALERVAAAAKGFVGELGALQLIEKEVEGRDKRLDLVSTSMKQAPIASFRIRAEHGRIAIWVLELPPSPIRILASGKPVASDITDADDKWVEAAIADLFATMNKQE